MSKDDNKSLEVQIRVVNTLIKNILIVSIKEFEDEAGNSCDEFPDVLVLEEVTEWPTRIGYY